MWRLISPCSESILRLVLITSLLYHFPVYAEEMSGNADVQAAEVMDDLVPSDSKSIQHIQLTEEAMLKEVNRQTRTSFKVVSASATHALLFVAAMASIGAAREMAVEHGLNWKDVSSNEIAKYGNEVIGVVAGGKFWAGLLAMGLSDAILKQAAVSFQQVGQQKELQKPFSRVLSGLVNTPLKFAIWDMGAQLVTEAGYLLEENSKADYERVMRGGVFWKTLWTAMTHPSEVEAEDLRVMGRMVQIMSHIVLFDDSLLLTLINNTLRTRTMSGDVVTFITALTVAGAVGTAACGGCGAVGGFIFGIIGGTISLFVPESYKDSLTVAIQDRRIVLVNGKLETNTKLLTNLFNRRPLGFYTDANSREQEFLRLLRARQSIRSDYYTLIYERARMSMKFMANADDDETLHGISLWRETFDQALKFTQIELEMLTLLAAKVENSNQAQISSALRSALDEAKYRVHIDQRLATAVDLEFEKLISLHIDEEIKASLFLAPNPKLKSVLNFVETSALRGFSEDNAVLAWARR